ncbi:MAG: hypothetical protein ABEH65_06560 [Halobacteriales archaeon]
MTEIHLSRRAALVSLGTVATISIGGCVGSIAGSQSDLQQQLDTVRKATEQYSDHTKALQDGFKIQGPFVPGMGWHFTHPQRLKDAAKNGFSLEKPPLLTYDSEMNLGAVEWGVPTKAIDETPDLFADENADATEKWHPHKSATHVFAVPDEKQTDPKSITSEQFTKNTHWAEFRPPNPDLTPGDTVKLHWGSLKAKQTTPKKERIIDLVQTHPDLTTLHAWVHADNPEGVFKPANPEFAQSMGSDGHSH